MKYENINGFNSLELFIKYKLSMLNDADANFSSLFNLMFSEADNIMYEESVGYKIRKVTYGEAKNEAIKYAISIKNLLKDVPKCSTVALNLDNSDKWIEAFWGILLAGYNPLLLNKRLNYDVLNKAIKDTNAVLVISSDSKQFSVDTIRLDRLDSNFKVTGLDECGDAIYVMSSGTSNNIKICGYTAEEFKYILLQSYDIIQSAPLIKTHYKGELKLLTFLPFYHIFGLVAVYTWFAFYSRTFVGLKDLVPSTIQNTIKRHHVTHIFAVPLFWEKTYEAAIKEIKNMGDKVYKKFQKGIKIADKIKGVPLLGKWFRKTAFKEVRDKMFGESPSFLISGGSMISQEVLSFFNLIGYHLANGYGTSEIGITSVELSSKKKYLMSGSVGRPLKYVNYQINNDGELIVNSKAMANFIIFEGKKQSNVDRWFVTHDLAKRVGDSYFLEGRKDDLLVPSNGENVNPNLVEAKLKVDGINGLCLIQNEKNNTIVLLVSINRFMSEERFENIKAGIQQNIENVNMMDQISKVEYIFTPLIEENDFKVNRRRVASTYAAGELELAVFNRVVDDNDDEMVLKIKELFAVALNMDISEIDSNANFFTDYGGTSLDYYLISSKVEEEYGISLVSSPKKMYSVREIVEFIKK